MTPDEIVAREAANRRLPCRLIYDHVEHGVDEEGYEHIRQLVIYDVYHGASTTTHWAVYEDDVLQKAGLLPDGHSDGRI